MAQAINNKANVAIVDYQMGNLFSVKSACEKVGLRAEITDLKTTIDAADAVILPGVGAFGDAMAVLNELDLVETLREFSESGKPFVGICLGLQLLMTESFEFGKHSGLDLIKGSVVRFEKPVDDQGHVLKVPQVGWNKIFPGKNNNYWNRSLLNDISEGEFMYFVHSFYVKPQDPGVMLSVSRYGSIEFCSAVKKDNICAFQFHPERSGQQGLKVYQNLANLFNK